MPALCPEPTGTAPGCSRHDPRLQLVGPLELVFRPSVQGSVCMHTRVCTPARAYAMLSREQPRAPHHWVTSAGSSGLIFFLSDTCL